MPLSLSLSTSAWVCVCVCVCPILRVNVYKGNYNDTAETPKNKTYACYFLHLSILP